MCNFKRLGHLYLVENIGDNLVGADVVSLGFVCDADTVAENIVAYRNYVFGHYKAALVQECIGAGGAGQRNGGTGRCAERNQAGQVVQAVFRRETGGEYQVDSTTFWASMISRGWSTGRTTGRSRAIFWRMIIFSSSLVG